MTEKNMVGWMGEIPLTLIDADLTWNCRSGPFWVEGYSEDLYGEGFEGLKAGIALVGLNEPIDVRIVEVNGEPRFSVVAGFRRHRAVTELFAAGQKVLGLTEGHIRCVIVPSDERQARLRNSMENLQREQVRLQDIAWSAHELYRLGMDVAEIACSFGKKIDHVRAMVVVFEKLPPKITNAWRAGVDLDGAGFGAGVRLGDMVKLAEFCPADLREQEYTKFYRSLHLHPQKKTSRGRTAQMKAARAQGAKLGAIIGLLLAEGVMELRAPMDEKTWRKVVRRERTGWTAEEWASVAASAQDAYAAALDKGETAEREGGDGGRKAGASRAPGRKRRGARGPSSSMN